MNFHTSRIPFQKDSSYKCRFCTKVLVPWRLISQVWSKCKVEVLDASGSNQSIETSCKNKFKLLKVLCFKKKDECQITAFLKLWNFSGRDIISDYKFLLSILNVFFWWHWKVLPKASQGKWYKRPSHPLLWLQYHYTEKLEIINIG